MQMMKGDKRFIIFALLPTSLIVGLFLYYPFIRGLWLTFYHMEGFITKKYTGFGNYVRLFTDPIILQATLNSLQLLLYVVIFQVGIALVLAVLVDGIRHGKTFFRTTFFFPVVISGTAIGLLFSLIYLHRGGMLNTILIKFGFEPVLWITESTSLIAVAIPTIWQYVGFYFIIILTAIMKIPRDFYEAADLDGIKGLKKTTHITIPLIFSDLKVCLILAITGAFKVFDLVKIITNGGPVNSSQVLGTYMYQQTFSSQLVGYGSTIAVLIVILGVGLSIIINKALKSNDVTY